MATTDYCKRISYCIIHLILIMSVLYGSLYSRIYGRGPIHGWGPAEFVYGYPPVADFVELTITGNMMKWNGDKHTWLFFVP